MIRFSAGLVVVALGVLIGGVVTSKLSLVYVSIAVSAVALTAWAIGVFLKRGELREELFGRRPELVPAGAGAAAAASAPERQASEPTSSMASVSSMASSSPTPAAATAVMPAPGQDRPGYGQSAFIPKAHPSSAPPSTPPRPTWTPKGPESPVGTRPVAPRAWDTPKGPPVPTGSGTDAADAASTDAGSTGAASAGALRSWFDRPASPPAGKAAETATDEPAAAAPAEADVSPALAAADATTVGAPAIADSDPDSDPDAVADLSDDAALSTDDDDDWPTRYSWLDDEDATELADPDEPLASDESPESSMGIAADAAVESELAVSDLAESRSPAASESAAAVAEDPDAEDPDSSLEAPAEPADADVPEDASVNDVPSSSPGADPSTGAESDAEPEAAADTEPESAADAQPGSKLVSVVPGVPRYHEPNCILIRFMPEDDVQQKTIPEAKAANCTPCAACQPED